MTPLLLVLALASSDQRVSTVKVPEGRALEIHGSTRVEPGKLVRPPLGKEKKDGVIVIEKQKGIDVDLSGVELRGVPLGTDLDRCDGWGIVVKDSEDVTIHGGTIGGYKGCIVATNVKRLKLDGVTFDGWYGMHLRSTVDAEDESDWLYPHENDAGQWITNYGGAISLTDCDAPTITKCTGRHGQNGILLTRTNGASIVANDFSFLSGWGLAMYRSSKALVRENAFDYCVRGYSHEVYWRGQDSAGILMFERCSDNVFLWNSATHGGDGVFLFAGNDTVEGRAFAKGELDAGGSDRNVWYENDFSFAVANAIEATFSSDNWAIGNRLDGSHQHGVWGGYSRRMVIAQNSIRGTIGGGISIEHGQECVIASNALAKNDVALELWWDEDKDLVEGPFGRHRDTSSRDTQVIFNKFEDNKRDLSLRSTKNVRFSSYNTFSPGGNLELREDASDPGALDDLVLLWTTAKGDRAQYGPSGLCERSSLRRMGDMIEGPAAAALVYPPIVPGGAQRWPDAVSGKRPPSRLRPRPDKEGLDTIVMGEWGPWDFRSGEPRPVAKKSGGLLADATWDATWFAWTKELDPREHLADYRKLASKPVASARVPNFNDPWSRDASIKSKTTTNHFGLVATTTIELPEKGKYVASVLSDDGVRLSIDGKPVVENWTWHAPTRNESTIELAKGKHTLDLEYFQIDGAYALSVALTKAP